MSENRDSILIDEGKRFHLPQRRNVRIQLIVEKQIGIGGTIAVALPRLFGADDGITGFGDWLKNVSIRNRIELAVHAVRSDSSDHEKGRKRSTPLWVGCDDSNSIAVAYDVGVNNLEPVWLLLRPFNQLGGKGDQLAITLYDRGQKFASPECPKDSGGIGGCTERFLIETDQDVVWRKSQCLGCESWQDSCRFYPSFEAVGFSLFSGQRRHLEPERTSPRKFLGRQRNSDTGDTY